MVLELDDIRVRDGLGFNGAQYGRRSLVNSANIERGGAGDSRDGEGKNAPHDDEAAERSGKGSVTVYLRLGKRKRECTKNPLPSK